MSNRSPRRLPSEIYLRRRIAAVVAILVVVGLIVAGLTAFANRGDDEPPVAVAETTSATEESTAESTETSRSDEPSTEPVETETESESATSETSRTQAAEGRDTCELSDLRITASSDQSSYSGDSQPTFYMAVENPTESDCVVDLSTEELRFEVYNLADNQRVWADTDCYPSVMEEEEIFEAGEERSFQAIWSRMGSQPGQCDNRNPVDNGAYFLHAVIGNNPSDAYPFNLN